MHSARDSRHDFGRFSTALVRRRGLYGLLTLVLGFAAIAGPVPDAATQTHLEAAGWLQLERDQAAYRERVGPLDLKRERELEVIERTQDLQWRSLQQQQRWEAQRIGREHRLDAGGGEPPTRARREWFIDQRRSVQQQRLRTQIQQDSLPFSGR